MGNNASACCTSSAEVKPEVTTVVAHKIEDAQEPTKPTETIETVETDAVAKTGSTQAEVEVSIEPEKAEKAGELEPGSPVCYYPAELTITPGEMIGSMAPKFWGNVVIIVLLGGSYRAALWSGYAVSAALAIASTLTLGTWQVVWQLAGVGIGGVPTWVMLLELVFHWLLFAGEKYFFGPFQSRSNLIATFALPLMYLPFKGRRLFGIGSGMVVRTFGFLSLFLGSYLISLRTLIQVEALQDMFYPVVAIVYSGLLNPIIQLTWQYFPGRRDCSALWVTSATATVAVSSEGFYYVGLVLMLAFAQGTDYEVTHRGAVSIATHAAFAVLGRFNVMGTCLLFFRRFVCRRLGRDVPDIPECSAQRDLILRTKSNSAILSWAIMFLACLLYMLASLSAHIAFGCERASPTCRFLYKLPTYLVALLAGFGMALTEVIVALGMRWLRQQRGSNEGGWTPLAIGKAVNQLSLPGMNCQPFATAPAEKIPDSVNLSISGVPGFLCLTPRECAALLSTNYALALIMATIGSFLVLTMKEEADALLTGGA